MATADSIKAKIQSLIDTANETTGQGDTTLTDAVNHLKDGYGQGGEYYDTFWNSYQENGKRTTYTNLFSGKGWNNTTFKPKYDIRPIGASMASCFYYSGIAGDLVEILSGRGLVMDTSKATSMNAAFNSTRITRFGIIDTTGSSSASVLTSAFAASTKLVTIDKLILKSDGSQTFHSTFADCSALENIAVEGVIGKALDLNWSTKLSKASITSIVNALSTTTSGLTLTLSQAAIDRISNDEGSYVWWYQLAGNEDGSGIRPNWTITTV